MRASISTKVSLTIASAFLVLTLAVLGIVAKSSLDFARRQATQNQEASMRVAWDVIGERGKAFRREGDTLLVGDHPLNGDFDGVDRVKGLVGGTATVFMGDKRITTNVTKPDGSRAVGTALAKGPVYDAVLGRGEPYRGEAKILGRPFFVAYDPIKDASGQVIGVLYVGVPRPTISSRSIASWGCWPQPACCWARPAPPPRSSWPVASSPPCRPCATPWAS